MKHSVIKRPRDFTLNFIALPKRFLHSLYFAVHLGFEWRSVHDPRIESNVQMTSKSRIFLTYFNS